MIVTLTSVAILILIYLTVWFVVSVILGRKDVADVAWGLGFITISFFLLLKSPNSPTLKLVSILVFFWGSRLAFHIFKRLTNTSEDPRYKQLAKNWQKSYYLSTYFKVFILQGFFMFLISLSLIYASQISRTNLTLQTIIGVIVWYIGFFFEYVADLQLSNFKNMPQNRDKIMSDGLWKFSRHPNYFGEVLQWWGIFTIVVSGQTWLSLISPITITILILFVSGVPLTEKRHQNRPGYAEYKKVTSLFIPWPPRK